MGEIQGKGRVGCSERNEMNFGNEKVRVRVEDDRISSLPDEIIHHILSFNDTKYAVQTSVLSSRWKLIWITLPHLSFSSSEYRTQLKFAEFVNQLLSSRDDHCEVSSLCFCFNKFVRQECIEKIISYALSHKVQKVKVIAPRLGGSVWNHQEPLCLLSSESLKDLTLFSFFNKFRSSVPQSPWDFPALTTLYLYDIQFCAENTKFVELFSKCLNLKNLTFRECCAVDLEVMKIIAPRLENLSIIRCSYLSFIVSAPNMSSFKYDDKVWCPASLSGDLLLLDMANLQMEFPFGNSGSPKLRKDLQRFEDKTFSMLEEVRNAEFLALHMSVIEFLSTVPDVLAHRPTPLSKLKCLNIKLDCLREPTNSAVIDRVVKYLVNSSSRANVIMELPEYEMAKLQKPSFRPHMLLIDGVYRWMLCGRRVTQQLDEVTEMLSSQEMTDPHVRQVLEDVNEKLVADCQDYFFKCWRMNKSLYSN